MGSNVNEGLELEVCCEGAVLLEVGQGRSGKGSWWEGLSLSLLWAGGSEHVGFTVGLGPTEGEENVATPHIKISGASKKCLCN